MCSSPLISGEGGEGVPAVSVQSLGGALGNSAHYFEIHTAEREPFCSGGTKLSAEDLD